MEKSLVWAALCLCLLCTLHAQHANTQYSSSASIYLGSSISSSSSSSSSSINDMNPLLITCRSVQTTLLSYCQNMVTYLVPSTTNETLQDSLAFSDGSSPTSCPYFTNPAYQCRKHFPRCQDATDPTQNATIYLMCQSSCFYGQQYDNQLCGHFSNEYFNNECLNTQYYGLPPLCDDTDMSSSDSSWIWKIALAAGLVLIGLIILVSYLRTLCRERRTPEDMDKEENDKARREQLALANRYQTINGDQASQEMERPEVNRRQPPLPAANQLPQVPTALVTADSWKQGGETYVLPEDDQI